MNYKKLVAKVRSKKKRALARYIPFNTHYRPSGIVSIKSPKKDDGIEYVELRAPYTSTLSMQGGLHKHLSPYIPVVNELPHPGNYMVKIKNGRLLQDGGSNMAIISGANRLIDEVSFQWNADQVLDATENVFLKQKGFQKPAYYPGTVFSLLAGGGARTYFYHWVVDAAPRLGLLQESGLFNAVDFFLVPNYDLPFQAQFLEHFGIKKERVINGTQVDHLHADSLIVTSYTVVKSHHPRWMCDWLYDSFISRENVQPANKFIYIARGDAGRNRKVLNEGAVISVLKQYGFEICYLSNMSITDQSRLFNSARVVVAPHGAGLTNLVFCQPGIRVLELFPDAYVRHVYCDISSKRGLEYDFLLCAADGVAENAIEGQKINLTVNIEKLIEKTERMIQHN